MKFNRRIASLLVTTLCLTSLVACSSIGTARRGSAGLDERLDSILHRLDRGDRPLVSGRVVELRSGRELYAENADEPVIPASNMKLLVTAAALDFFGPDHAFKTYLAWDRSNNSLWVVGTGDVGIGDQPIAARRGGDTLTVFDQWVDAIRRREGGSFASSNATFEKLYYYDGALEEQRVHPTWAKDDLVHWYAAPVSGLNFNDNCVDITIYPTEEGKPVRYEVMPAAQDVAVVNNCVTGSKHAPEIERSQDENVYTISGTCKEKTALKSKPVTDPGAFFADALRTHLKANGIEVKSIERATRPPFGSVEPPPEMLLAVHETKLRELLPRINKNSQNLLAEGLCKLLGRAYDHERWRPGPGSWASGSDAIHAFLDRLGIEDEAIVVADGSGLSRDNRVTTRTISDLLVKMKSHPHADVFFDSLSVGGVDGTIRARFTDKPGVVRAKTGFIGGVRSLSGVTPSKRGPIVFSFIYNRVPGSVKPYEELQDYAVRTLMSWPELDYAPPPTTQPATQPEAQPTTRPRTRPVQPATSPIAGG